MFVHVDIESQSELDLTVVGVYAYAAHPSTAIMSLSWAVDDGEPQLWKPGRVVPVFPKHTKFCAYNAEFELVMLNAHPGQDIGFQPTTVDDWEDVMAYAAYSGFPRKLDAAAAAVGSEKDLAGHKAMLVLSKPRRTKEGGFWTPETAPEKFALLYEYNKQDVVAERAVMRACYPLPAMERAAWKSNVLINATGWRIDTFAVEHAVALSEYEDVRLEKVVTDITGGIRPTQRDKLLGWVRDQGVKIANLQKGTVQEVLEEASTPESVRTVLTARLSAGLASVKKYNAALMAVGADNRLRGLFRYYTAVTGRFSSSLVQLHNMARGEGDQPEKARALNEHDMASLTLMYGDLKRFLSEALRGVFIGRPLVVCDYSAIEARVIAWLAHEPAPLKVFTQGGDIYVTAAAGIYHKPESAINDNQRFVGKVAILALGFQGAVGAFASMAKSYGVEMADSEILPIVKAWRKANPNIVKLWGALEKACKRTIIDGQVRTAGHGKLRVSLDQGNLHIRLPSGRALIYRDAAITEGKITFADPRGNFRGETYGGKLTENVVQAIARDLLVDAIDRLLAAGFRVVGHVHDEVIADGGGTLEEMTSIMTNGPDWAAGLPLDAKGWTGDRYKKG